MFDRFPEANLDSTPAQHPLGGPRHALAESGKQPVGEVGEQPAHPLIAQRGELASQPGREQLSLRGDLGARVAGPDDDESAPRVPFVGVGGRRGQLQLPGDVIAQVQRLGDPSEAVRVLGNPGDGEQLVDAARGEHQTIEFRRPAPSLGVDPLDPVSDDVDVR